MHKSIYLEQLESESIQIIREVVSEFENPVMLYSMGKDSSVMLRLALKSFFPAPIPFPILHIDTTWKFKEMIQFRKNIIKEHNLKCIIHVNKKGIDQNISPFKHGSRYTDIMKTDGLKQVVEKYKFDALFGGARRDEEKSRSKERIFSFRNKFNFWDSKNQRPELWNIYNTQINPGENIRVFPLSNWTEIDIWQYIHLEQIPIVPLYYGKIRPVVNRDNNLIMVDDERFELYPNEKIEYKSIRFRTLGCYPLTTAIESTATTIPDIIDEIISTNMSERNGRLIDYDQSSSMEKKKQEGYF